jgi:hypothetical protein
MAANRFVGMLMNSREQAHMFHLTTKFIRRTQGTPDILRGNSPTSGFMGRGIHGSVRPSQTHHPEQKVHVRP